ncbi:MAG TPA: glucokinase [Thermoanaerobaculia bacterium]
MTTLPLLAGDLGGTNLRLGLFTADPAAPADPPHLLHAETFASADFDGLAPVIDAFLAAVGVAPADVAAACCGVAGPVLDNRTRTPNLAWEIDGDEVAAGVGLGRLTLINDLLATAEGLPALTGEQVHVLQEGRLDPDGHAALIAAGTGLGMSLLPRVGEARLALPSEGGHQDFAPRNDDEAGLLAFLGRRHGHVSVERVVSGPGLVAIYHYLRDSGRAPEDPELADRIERTDPGDAISRAATGGDPLAAAALDLFVAAYGAAAGNLALVAFATGGLWVGGGIAPKVLDRLIAGPFLAAFRDKGRFRSMMEAIPVSIVLEPATALYGAARVAAREAAAR